MVLFIPEISPRLQSILEVGPSRYMLPSTTDATTLQASYDGKYKEWVGRVGETPHPYWEGMGL
jgi:hypothetical protein